MNRITHEAGDFVPGKRMVTFPVDGHKIGAFICYESAFPDLVRQFTKAGANVLVNLSNDGYFGHSAAREQHLELVRMRAAENRRWILRATNDGITAMIDPAGRDDRSACRYTRRLRAVFGYYSLTELTPYVRYGDWFAWSVSGGLDWPCQLSVPDHEHVAVLDDVLFSFQAQQAFFAHAGIAVVLHQRLPVDHFGADELLLEVAVDRARRFHAVLFIGMVQARTSVSPAVRNSSDPARNRWP